jgi:hypothetical protein
MKKTILTILSLLLLLPAAALAANGSVTATNTAVNDDVMVITVTWLADSSTAAVTETTLADAGGTTITVNGWVFLAVTNPGTVSPTDNYDIYVDDQDGCDIFGAALENRDQVNSEQAVPTVGTTLLTLGRFVEGYLTFDVENNSTNAATGVVRIYYYRYRHNR